MSLRDVPAQDLIEKTAVALKDIDAISPPAWAAFAKTTSGTQKPPVREDWWHVRAASILRKLALLGPVGVSKLRVKYGVKKNRGYAEEHFRQAAGNHIRKILQQLEKAGLAMQEKKALRKGRLITPKGMSFLDKVAAQIMKEQNITIAKRPDTKLEDMMPKEAKKPRAKKEKKEGHFTEAKDVVQESTEVKPAETEKPKKPRAPRKPKEAKAPTETASAETKPSENPKEAA